MALKSGAIPGPAAWRWAPGPDEQSNGDSRDGILHPWSVAHFHAEIPVAVPSYRFWQDLIYATGDMTRLERYPPGFASALDRSYHERSMIIPAAHPCESERLALLRRCGILDTAPEADFDGLVDLAAHIADAPIALISLIDEGRQWFKARHGLEATETPRAHAFCAHAILDPKRPFIVPDARLDPRFAGNPLVDGGPRVVFYVGVPLQVGPDRLPLGTLCIIDHRARQIDERIVAQLRRLAHQAERLFEMRLHQRQIEDRLVEVAREEERVSAIIATMDEGLMIQRRDGRILSSNPAASRILGLSTDQLVGRSSHDPDWRAVRADGSPFPGDQHPAMQALATGQTIRGVVMGVDTGAGERRWILINAQPTARDAAGLPQTVVCSFSDITALRREECDRRRAESQVDRFFTVSLELLCIADANGHFRRVNPAWTRVLGWSAGELIGRPFLEFVHPDDRAATTAEAAHLGQGGVTVGFENRYLAKNGEWRRLRWTVALDGDTLLAVARDVTDERAHEAELMRARDAAEAAGRAKGEFLATMSHEIRTPMNGVIGLTDALLGTPLSGEQRDMLGSIRESGRALMAILNDILDWSRIEAGRLALESVPVGAQAVVRDVVTVLAAQATAKGLRLELDAGPEAAIQGDAGRIRQILFNLIGNAIKFTVAGEVRVRFEVLPAVAGRSAGSGRFTVTDTGIGIPAGRIAGLFQRFAQLDASTTRRFGGSGLGLAISRHLAVLMEGEIAISSTVGVGSTFSVLLPLAASAPQPVAGAPVAASAQRALRLLLAEDNPINQRVAVALLTQAGHQVEIAGNGVEAVAAFHRGGWDAVLLDVQMPEMDGLDATRAMRTAEVARGGRRLPIVALTASAMADERAACHSAGMDDVLAKPLTRESLRGLLARWCP